MSKWILVSQEKYKHLAQSKVMTDTHIRKYNDILYHIQINDDNWNTWRNESEPMDDIEIFETAKQISWDINSVNEKKDPYKGTNYREEWHIHRRWKHSCKQYGEDEHHSHVICIKCKEIAFGIFVKCECNKFRREKAIDQINENNRSCSDEELRRFSSSTRKTCEVQDACFITATVFEKDINVMLDTGSFSSVITKMYLDKMNIDIEKPANVKIIDINGNKKAPLGKVNVPVVINNDKWIIEMIVTDSRNYNVILGNQWIGKVGGILNFNDGIFSYENNSERDSTLMTCWQRMSNSNVLYEI